MKVTTKILILILVLTCLSLTGAISYYLNKQKQYYNLIDYLEKDNENYFIRIMELEQHQMYLMVFDYSLRESMVKFVQGKQPVNWASSNLDSILDSYRVDATWIFDSTGKVIYNHYNTNIAPLTPIPGDAKYLSVLFKKKPFAHYFLKTPQGIMEIHASPVRTMSNQRLAGFPNGFFIVGRYWNQTFLDTLKPLTGGEIQLSLYPHNNPSNPARGIISYTKELVDWNQKPVAYINVKIKSGILEKINRQNQNIIIVTPLYILLVVCVWIFLLIRWIQSPVNTLSKSLQQKSPAPLEKLVADKGEFGDFSRLIVTFFQQQQDLLVEIKERKHAEESVSWQLAFQQRMMDTIPIPVYFKDDAGFYLGCNEAFERFNGLHQKDVVGKTADSLFGDEWVQQNQLHEHQLLEHGGMVTYENTIPGPDGKLHHTITHKAAFYDTKGNIAGLVGTFVDITEKKEAEELLRQTAFYDFLTKMPNRTLFSERLHHCIARAKRNKDYHFAVLFLDMDRFKDINDSMGHLVGDQVLVTACQRLKNLIRESDMLARLGGDEFIILMEEINSPMVAIRLAERVLEDFSEPLHMDNREIFVSFSIGIALSQMISGEVHTSEEILQQADIALYKSKEWGRSRYTIFDQAMHETFKETLILENELRRTIRAKQLQLYFQPIIELHTGRIYGFEALVYWNHHKRGLLSPSDFIPLAEETGLIHQLGEWVLHESCRQLVAWRNQYPQYPDLTIGINVSPKQIEHPNFSEEIAGILKSSTLDPQWVHLEITETSVLKDPEKILSAINKLHELGIHFHLDDFGTGYSSLSHIIQFPISHIKIDREFISNMTGDKHHRDIVHAIVSLGKSFNLEIIAEGIETPEQEAILRQEGCHFGQGYYYARPMLAADVALYLNNYHPGFRTDDTWHSPPPTLF